MTRAQVSEILNLMNRNDRMCQGSPQQVANGFYRVVDILILIIKTLDEDKQHLQTVQSIFNTLQSNERFCQGAPQQSANGSYRTCELMKTLIKLFDKSGSCNSKVVAIFNTLQSNERFCQGAPQQVANGTYRIVELLQILQELIAPKLSTETNRIINTMNSNEVFCQGAPQQSANGTGAIASIVELLARDMDKERKYTSRIAEISSIKQRNNALCQGADQQSANYLYRTMELLQVITNIMIDGYEERTKQYWLEHATEKKELLARKDELKSQIAQFKREANAVCPSKDISVIKMEISDLSNKMEALGQDRIKDMKQKIAAKEAEKNAIGFFKFSARRAVAEQIDALNEQLRAIEQEIEAEKAPYKKQISNKKAAIKSFENEVSQKKQQILNKCRPCEQEIQKIDDELTRQR